MKHRIFTLMLACAAMAALAGCDPKPTPPKAAGVGLAAALA